MAQTLHRKRFLVHGTNALVMTIAVLGALVVGYVLVDRYRPFRLDLTKGGLHSLAPKTIEILGKLDKDVHVTFFELPRSTSDADFVNKRVEDLLEEFKVRSKGRLTYELRYGYGEDELVMAELGGDFGSAVFQVGEAKVVVQSKDIFQTSWSGFGEEGPSTKFTGEEAFDQAILQLLEGKSRTACFLAGHGEPEIEGRDENGFLVAKELLRRENLESKEIRLSPAGAETKLDAPLSLDVKPEAAVLGDVPSDCTVLVVAGPKSPISAPEADAIVKYWESGRGLVIFAEPMTQSGVDKLVARLGLEMLPGVAADPSGQTRSPLAMIPEYGRHPIVDDLAGVEIATVLIRAAGFRAPATPDASTTFTPLLKTSPDGMQLTEIQDGIADPKSPKNVKGPIDLAFAVEKKSGETTSRAVVIGDVDFARNMSIQAMAAQGAPGNIDLLKNAVNWSAGAAEKVGISPKDPEFNPVTISDRAKLWVLALTGLVLPAGIFGTGLTVWIRRRRR